MKRIDYDKIYKIMGDLTPLYVDCGELCSKACCKGDENTGMMLFPYEESFLEIRDIPEKGRLAVCNGTCDRSTRPLACRIFPFFPAIDKKGKISVVLDLRAHRLCPMIEYCEHIEFNKKFFKAVKKIGNILKKDDKCRQFLIDTTEEIDMYNAFLQEKNG